MIVDTSAIIAILRGEPEADQFMALIDKATATRMSAANYLEAAIVVDGQHDGALSAKLDMFIAVAGIVIEPVTERQARLARDAYRDFGRGSGHPARLNFGDCFAYALARDFSEQLLFKGSDFAQTDIATMLA